MLHSCVLSIEELLALYNAMGRLFTPSQTIVHSLGTPDSDHTGMHLHKTSSLFLATCLSWEPPSLHTSMTRLILGRKKYEHVTPMLVELHWLPVKGRIVYKICLFVFKCLNHSAPQYLQDLVIPYKQKCSLHSQNLMRNIQQCRRELERDHSHLMLENTGIFCQRNQDSPERLIGSNQI